RQVVLGRVRTLVHERELALRVIEGGRRPRRHAVELSRDLELRVVEVFVRDRFLLEEVLGIPAVVVRVHAQEDDLALPLVGLVAEQWELEPARAAPAGPLVHDYWSAALLLELRLERGVA